MSSIELDKLDANCNNCKFMKRDMERFNQSLEQHNKWQLDYFNVIKSKLIEKAKERELQGDIKLHDTLIKEAEDMRFQFDRKEAAIQYGTCEFLNKPISFLPNTLQIETQKCFKHRKDGLSIFA